VVQLGSLVMRYAAEGYQEVIRADRQVRDNVSKTARHAQRDEAKTKGWLQRHKTALLAITGAISGAMYTITKNSPSMSAAIGEIRLAFSMFFMDVGERAAPFFDNLADLTWKLLDKWENLPEYLKDIIVGGTPELLDHWDELLLGMAGKIDDIFGTGDLFESMTQLFVDAVKDLWGKIKPTITKLPGQIADTIRDGLEAFKDDPVKFVGEQLDKIADKVTDWLPTPFSWGSKTIGGFVDGLLSKVEEIPGVADSKIFGALKTAWEIFSTSPITWGKKIVENLVDGISSGESSLLTVVGGLLSAITTKFTSWLPGTIQWGGLLVGGLTEGVDGNKIMFTGSIDDIIGTISGKITGWISDAKDWGMNLISRITDGVNSQEPSLITKIGDVITTVTDKFAGIASGAIQWGKDLIAGITEGVGTGEPSLLSRIDSLVGTITSKITGGLSDAVQWGKDLIGGITEGAGTTEVSLIGRITSTTSNVTGKITEWLGGAKDWGMNLIAGIVGGVREKEENLYTNVTGVQTKVTRQFLDWIPNARKWGSDLMSNFIGGISSMFGALSSTLNAARRMVESALSFDIAANDRMAYRWGTDLVRHFEAGMRSAQFAVPTPVMAPVSPVGVGGGGGGTTGSRGDNVYITIEAGAVQVRGADAKAFDERALSRIIRDEIGQALRERSR